MEKAIMEDVKQPSSAAVTMPLSPCWLETLPSRVTRSPCTLPITTLWAGQTTSLDSLRKSSADSISIHEATTTPTR